MRPIRSRATLGPGTESIQSLPGGALISEVQRLPSPGPNATPVVAERNRSSTRTKLMKAAETLFAEQGIKAVSIRDIAALAGVNSALIAYYFGSKEELFVAVYKSMAAPINAERHRAFDALERLPRAATIEELLTAWIRPVLSDCFDVEPSHFIQLALVAAVHDPSASGRLSAETFEELNERFLDRVQECLPSLSRATLVWRLYFLIGAMAVAARQRTRGMSTLSRGQCNPHSLDEMVRELVTFAAAGFRADAEQNGNVEPAPAT